MARRQHCERRRQRQLETLRACVSASRRSSRASSPIGAIRALCDVSRRAQRLRAARSRRPARRRPSSPAPCARWRSDRSSPRPCIRSARRLDGEGRLPADRCRAASIGASCHSRVPGPPIEQHGGQLVVAVGKDVRGRRRRALAGRPLDREAPVVNLRPDALDHDAADECRIESAHRAEVAAPARVQSSSFDILLTLQTVHAFCVLSARESANRTDQ